jgi:hypothetical protein
VDNRFVETAAFSYYIHQLRRLRFWHVLVSPYPSLCPYPRTKSDLLSFASIVLTYRFALAIDLPQHVILNFRRALGRDRNHRNTCVQEHEG